MGEKLHILLWRSWIPLYEYPATFSTLAYHSIGGTCSQLLWHAKILTQMGHCVQILGATRVDLFEEGIEFVGSCDQLDQERLLGSGRIHIPDVIFLEGAFAGAELFKSLCPGVKVIHIGQNIDRYGCRRAFRMERAIDIYGFVGQGQFADYCVRYPRLRHKFLMVRNIVPWKHLYQQITPLPVEDNIVWVGAWTKQGLRSWAETMQRVLWEYPSFRWTLCGPRHGTHIKAEMPAYILRGLRFRSEQLSIQSLPLLPLAQRISSARIVLVSLGNEAGPISILDAHAMGRPVLSGNDMVYKYSNPEGTGIRVTTAQERYKALVMLIQDLKLGDRLGAAGKALILSDYTEQNQRNDLERVLGYLRMVDALGGINAHRPPTALREYVSIMTDKIKRKVLSIGTDSCS